MIDPQIATTAQTIVGLLGVLAGFASIAAAIYLEQATQARQALESNIPLISDDLVDFSDGLFGDRLGHDANHELRTALVPLLAARGSPARISGETGRANDLALAELSQLSSPSRRLHAMLIALVVSAFPKESPGQDFIAQSSGVALLRISSLRDEIVGADTDIFNRPFANDVATAVAALRDRTSDAAAAAAAGAHRLHALQSYWHAAALVAAASTAFCLEIIGRTASSIVPGGTTACPAADPMARAMEFVTLGLFLALAGMAAISILRLWEILRPRNPDGSLEGAVRQVFSPPRRSPKAILAGIAVAMISLGLMVYMEATNPFLQGLARCL